MKLLVEDIEIELIRKSIKHMHLYVLRPDGRVRITAPMRLSTERIVEFITSRTDWIRAQRARIAAEPRIAPLTYSDGETIMIFGKPYILEVISSNKNNFSYLLGKAELYCKPSSTPEQRKAIVEKALRESLYAKIKPLFEKWELITGLKPSSYQVKKMKTRWGTCNTRTKKIWLNLELVHKSDECIEYVIMHELAHLRVSDHGKDFIAIMDYYMPRWKEIREALNQR